MHCEGSLGRPSMVFGVELGPICCGLRTHLLLRRDGLRVIFAHRD
jgi:hypothetical protein